MWRAGKLITWLRLGFGFYFLDTTALVLPDIFMLDKYLNVCRY